MTNGLKSVKNLSANEALEIAKELEDYNKTLVDTFVTNEFGNEELVVTVALKIPLSKLKQRQGFKAIVQEAKLSEDCSSVEIITVPESRMPSGGSAIHFPSGELSSAKSYSDYSDFNIQQQHDFIKKNNKNISERYQQFKPLS